MPMIKETEGKKEERKRDKRGRKEENKRAKGCSENRKGRTRWKEED